MPKTCWLVLGTLLLLPSCGKDSPAGPGGDPLQAVPPSPSESTIQVNAGGVPARIANNGRTTSNLDVTTPGNILEVAVLVSIGHTWRGDLDIRLQHPDGTLADLFIGDPADSRDDVVEIFTPGNAPTLQRLVDKPSAGTWTLVIDDTRRQDKGDLNSWSLRIRLRR
jgi:subtilisin-like proprotein convertase family protein